MRKHAETLAKEHELGDNENDFFQYIVDSLINGQRQQVRDLFNSMKQDDQRTFLNDFLQDDNSHHTSTRKICVAELV